MLLKLPVGYLLNFDPFEFPPLKFLMHKNPNSRARFSALSDNQPTKRLNKNEK